MAWIETPREDTWDGDLADLYAQLVDRDHDRVDNIMQIHALNPRAMAAHHALYISAMAGTKNLRKVDREMIALVVSTVNECHY
ncbi:MAG: peroxidase [Actinomycetota bacterium]|nr:peroxidase [Actinomycetota bacterium]